MADDVMAGDVKAGISRRPAKIAPVIRLMISSPWLLGLGWSGGAGNRANPATTGLHSSNIGNPSGI
jgi:hypothetical protein